MQINEEVLKRLGFKVPDGFELQSAEIAPDKDDVCVKVTLKSAGRNTGNPCARKTDKREEPRTPQVWVYDYRDLYLFDPFYNGDGGQFVCIELQKKEDIKKISVGDTIINIIGNAFMKLVVVRRLKGSVAVRIDGQAQYTQKPH